MAETAMKSLDMDDASLWAIDDSIPYDPSLLEGFVPTPEMEAAMDALIDELFGPEDAIQAAA